MTGSAPTVSIALDSATPYAQGATLTASAVISDPDNTTETLTAVDSLGRQVTETIVRVDPDTVTWFWQSAPTVPIGTGTGITVPVPQASDVLVCVVVDGQANTTTATVPVTVQQPMLVGTTFLTSDAATHAKLFPGNAFYRVYTPQGNGIYGWTSKQVQAVPAGATMMESFKDTPTSVLMAPWFAAIPPAVARVMLCVHHEPEGDLPVSQYDSDWTTLGTLRDAAPNGHKVLLVQDLTEYAELHGKGPWQNWITDVCDAIGVDCYRNAIAGDTYPDPATFFALPVAISQATGKPWVVPEFGGDRISTDTTGSGRAAWMTACVKYARSNGCIAIAWFCEPGTTSKAVNGYHLDACAPELAAWKAAIASQ